MSSRTLATYNRKRNFRKTAEPPGKPGGGKAHGRDQHRFVIQKHVASHLHFDFRLEHDGVLKSWAVPRGPSLDPADKRLAVQVEDHPIEYGRFEGTIPEGEYGGGTVQLWDRGHWHPVETEDAGRAFKEGKIAFELDGERLHGRWALVQMRGPRSGGGKNWLLIKEKDRYVRTGKAADIAAIDKSVASGRSLAEIAASGPASHSKITLSHPDKRLWPKERITKADLASYYARMAEPLLRFAGHRPLSIIRAPDGIDGEKFFQRHHNRGTSTLIGKVKPRGEAQPYLVVEDAEGLRALAQWGALELHPWGATVADLDHPDQIIFDFDPDDTVPFSTLKLAALAMRDRLDALGLASFPKLTGGKGLHVVVPLKPRADWGQVKAFSHALAAAFAAADPAHFIAEAGKAKRKGKVFVDYLRNARTATAVACWSPRARSGAPIAVPVSWAYLKQQRRLPVYSLRKLDAALKHIGDWDDFETSRRVLTKTMLRRAGV